MTNVMRDRIAEARNMQTGMSFGVKANVRSGLRRVNTAIMDSARANYSTTRQ
jgi:hypothetical protein